jgi:hypothetical protein
MCLDSLTISGILVSLTIALLLLVFGRKGA